MRIATYIILLLIAPVMAGLYGFIHDQITYSISEEFFTKVRFQEFHLPDYWPDAARAGVIGVINAMKAGVVFGIVLTAVGKIHKKATDLLNYTLYAFLITCFMAFACTMLAVYMPQTPVGLMDAVILDSTIVNPIAFQRVIRINNFGYAGGIIGMLMGVGLQVYFYKKNLKMEVPGTPKA